MNGKQFARYVFRDGGCVHCGATDAIVPHHRANRGMGGSKLRDVPSNIITMCHDMNNRMESDSKAAELAREMGWKLSTSADPASRQFWHAARGEWLLIDDDFNSTLWNG